VGLAVIVPVGAAVVALTAVVLTGAVRDNLTLTDHDRALHNMLNQLPGRPLVFVAANPKYLGHPTPVTANGPDLDGRVLYAVARGVDDFTVLADHPGRPAYLLRFTPAYDRSPGSPSTARVERLAVRGGDQVLVTIAIGADATPVRTRSAYLLLTVGTRRLSMPVDPRVATTLTLSVDADGLDPADISVAESARPARGAVKPGLVGQPTVRTVPAGRGTSLSVVLRVTDQDGHEHTVDQQVLPVRRPDDEERARWPAQPAVTVLGSVGQIAEVGTGARPPLRVTLAAVPQPSRGDDANPAR
jgi:hypothetical protein